MHIFARVYVGFDRYAYIRVFSNAYRRAFDFAHIRVLNTRIYAI